MIPLLKVVLSQTRSGLKTSEYYDRNIVIPYTAQPHREYTFFN
jgi:hypothetical protein